MPQSLARLIALCALPTALGLTGQKIASYFVKTLSPGSRIYLPTDADYSNETIQRWDIFNPPTYVISVQPALEADLQKVPIHGSQLTPAPKISYGHANNIPFLGTGGGHGYSTTLGALQSDVKSSTLERSRQVVCSSPDLSACLQM